MFHVKRDLNYIFLAKSPPLLFSLGKTHRPAPAQRKTPLLELGLKGGRADALPPAARRGRVVGQKSPQ